MANLFASPSCTFPLRQLPTPYDPKSLRKSTSTMEREKRFFTATTTTARQLHTLCAVQESRHRRAQRTAMVWRESSLDLEPPLAASHDAERMFMAADGDSHALLGISDEMWVRTVFLFRQVQRVFRIVRTKNVSALPGNMLPERQFCMMRYAFCIM